MLGTSVLSTVYVFPPLHPSPISTFPPLMLLTLPDVPTLAIPPYPFGSLANPPLAWSPDSRFLAVGGQDDLITLFSPREARVVARCQGHSAFVTSIAFDPGRGEGRGYRFASVGEDGKLILVSPERSRGSEIERGQRQRGRV